MKSKGNIIKGGQQSTQDSITIPKVPDISVSTNVNVIQAQSKDNLIEKDMETVTSILVKCGSSIREAHANAKEAYKYQKRVRTFLNRKITWNDGVIDYGASNGPVNFRETKSNDGNGNNYYYVGNISDWTDLYSDIVGRWTKTKDWFDAKTYVFEGKHTIPGDSKQDSKESGVEMYNDDEVFYGKFEKETRKSGDYAWTKKNSRYIGDFSGGIIHGHGCYVQLGADNNSSVYYFGEFNDGKLDKKCVITKGTDIFFNDKKLSESDKKEISSFITDASREFKELNWWEGNVQALEEKTGFGRTSLYALAAASLVGIGYLGYKLLGKTRKKSKKSDSKNKSADGSASPSASDKSADGSASAEASNKSPDASASAEASDKSPDASASAEASDKSPDASASAEASGSPTGSEKSDTTNSPSLGQKRYEDMTRAEKTKYTKEQNKLKKAALAAKMVQGKKTKKAAPKLQSDGIQPSDSNQSGNKPPVRRSLRNKNKKK
jgi:hypothetical protein